MSFIVKGVDLPTNRETLIVGIDGDGNVSIEHSKPLVLVIEPSAKAIQIPKGHGRIIDENDAIDNVACFHGTAWLDTDEIEPILEAEEE